MEQFRSDQHTRTEQRELESDEAVLEAAYKKALQTETDKIQMDEFIDVYGEETVKKHKTLVSELRAEFDKNDSQDEKAVEARKFGKILEAILVEQIELNDWLGPDVDTQQTTDYDDYLNKIDFISEFRRNGGRNFVGFAIDATHGVMVIRRKMEKIRKEIDRGELGQVQYFRTRDGSIQGRQRFIPKIVLALDKKNVLEIARIWVQGKNKALTNHPLRTIFVRELFSQLHAQRTYVDESIKRGAQNLDDVKRMLDQQCAFLESSIPKPEADTAFDDEGLEMIQETCRVMFLQRESGTQVKTRKEKEQVQFALERLKQEQAEKAEREARVHEQRTLEQRARSGDKEAREQIRRIEKEKRLADKIKNGELWSHEIIVMDPDALVKRYQELVKRRQSGEKFPHLIRELALITNEFTRRKNLNRAKDFVQKKNNKQNTQKQKRAA